MPIPTSIKVEMRDGNGELIEEIPLNEFSIYEKTSHVRAIQMNEQFSVNGVLGYSGDYLCLSITGELAIISKDVFDMTYRKVSD